jgi:hypothetical protein
MEADAKSLESMYERRCKNLSNAAVHWKDQTRNLIEKFYSSLQTLKLEHTNNKVEYDNQVRVLENEFHNQISQILSKHEEVFCF